MATTLSITELAIEILQATNDGDLLAPCDLTLVELAVNGMLNVNGEAAFLRLHENARKSEGYTRPFFLGIEHLAQDHTGYISWKGVVVDPFDHGFCRLPGWQDRMKADAQQLAARCRELEERGVQPSVKSVLNFDSKRDSVSATSWI